MKLIKVAIIGAGKIAEEHIKAFKALKTTKIVGIFSRTESKAIKLKNKYKISKVYTNIDNMYLGSLPDLVIVAVSILSVREVLKKVSKYEWYCLCEKPIGINYKETCKTICEKSIKLLKNQKIYKLDKKDRNYILNFFKEYLIFLLG